MIRYTLKCSEGHSFESWFASSDAFDMLQAAGHVGCAVCGSCQVEKSLMAPKVTTSRDKTNTQPQDNIPTPATPDPTQMIEKMRKEVEENSDYVGLNFAKQARDMHLGDAPKRAIYGEAKHEEAKALIEDGVPVAPLPFIPKRKTN